jgi:hypothetical protein
LRHLLRSWASPRQTAAAALILSNRHARHRQRTCARR